MAAERGFVDAVIDPADTRREVAAAFEACWPPSARRLVEPQARQHALCERYPVRACGTIAGVAESITITDNRTGESIEVPIVNGGVDATEWRKLLPGRLVLRPGVHDDRGVASSAITELDGENGHPALPRLPDRAAGRAVDLPRGRLPAHPRRAAHRRAVRARGSTTSRTTRSSTRTCASGSWRASTTTPTRWGCSCRPIAALSTFYPDAKDIHDPDNRYKQIVRLIAKMPTLAAALPTASASGMPFVYPDNRLGFTANFLSMMWKVAEPRYDANPALAQALDVLFILHADHEQNCGTTAMRMVGSAHADPYSCTAAAAAALYGPRHGGANEAVIHMLTEIGSIDNVAAFIESREGRARAGCQGFGHRVYKNYDPRATIIKQTADEVFEVTGKNPLLDIALKLEEVALSDDYFISRKLYPNVDFYSGLIYQAMGFPIEMFTVLFAIPRTAGLAGALGGAARAGPEDRPAPPALHRHRRCATTSPIDQR